MQTSVRTEILDNSIPGEKIQGGTLQGLDSLYVDNLYIPWMSSPGSAQLSGSGIEIGLLGYVPRIYSEGISGWGSNVSSVWESENFARAELGIYNNQPILDLYDDFWVPKVHLTGQGDPFNPNYIVDKLVIGATTGSSDSYLFEVFGPTRLDNLYTDFIQSFGDIYVTEDLTVVDDCYFQHQVNFWTLSYGTQNLNDVYSRFLEIETKVDNMSFNLTIAGGLTNSIAQQLTNIQLNTITNADWTALAGMGSGSGSSVITLAASSGFGIGSSASENRLQHFVSKGSDFTVLNVFVNAFPVPASMPLKYQILNDTMSLYVGGFVISWSGLTPNTNGEVLFSLSDSYFDDFWTFLGTGLTYVDAGRVGYDQNTPPWAIAHLVFNPITKNANLGYFVDNTYVTKYNLVWDITATGAMTYNANTVVFHK